MSQVHTLTSGFSIIHFSIILPLMPRSFLLVFRSKFCMCFSTFQAHYLPHHLVLLDLITLIMFYEEYQVLSSSLWRTPLPTSNLSNPFCLWSPLNYRDQVLHSYKTRGKILFMCILIYRVLILKIYFNRKRPKCNRDIKILSTVTICNIWQTATYHHILTVQETRTHM